MEYIEIGQIVNTHGLKGELKIESWSDFDELRYQKGNTVYLTADNSIFQPFTVSTYRVHKGYPLVSFDGYADINLVEKYKGYIVCIEPDGRQELEEGEFYFDELIGLMVKDESENVIGEVISVEETNGAQNNLRVLTAQHKEILIPFVPVFIKDVDLDNCTIIVHVVEGML